MNKFIFTILIFIFAINTHVFSCQPRDIPNDIFTLSDAQDILGENGHLLDSSMKAGENVITYNCAYVANSTDQATGR